MNFYVRWIFFLRNLYEGGGCGVGLGFGWGFGGVFGSKYCLLSVIF